MPHVGTLDASRLGPDQPTKRANFAVQDAPGHTGHTHPD